MRIRDQFTNEEIKTLCERRDAHAWLAVATNWGIIAGSFALVAIWTNPLTMVMAIILLGGRQLGLGVLMHECGHGTLFRTRRLNQLIGEWLCAGPVFYKLDSYMSNHLRHHAKAGSIEDPDLSRYQSYPVSAASLKRKAWRDLSGQTTWNFLRTTLRANKVIALDEDRVSHIDWMKIFRQFHVTIISNGLLIAVLIAFGVGYLYLIWLAAFFSTYMFFSRIRNLAEHAAVHDLFNPNPIFHTRTTLARWWERLTFAPNSVNYHLEHHLLPSVPKYRLAKFHVALKQKGLLDNADITVGYIALIRKLILQPIVA